jgi:hypothetical protein
MGLRTLLSAGKPNGRPLFSLLGDQKFERESNSLSDAEVEKFHQWRLRQGGANVLKESSSGCSQFRAGDESTKKFATCGLFVSVCPHNVAGSGRRMNTVCLSVPFMFAISQIHLSLTEWRRLFLAPFHYLVRELN